MISKKEIGFFALSVAAATALITVWTLPAPLIGRKAPPLQPEPVAAIQTDHAGVFIKVYDPSLEWSANLWRSEISRRFPNAVGILLHGGEVVEGEWHVRPEGSYLKRTADVVRDVQRQYPGKTIVVLACNPGHNKLGIPGVYYAKDSVWCVPDRNTQDPQFKNRLTAKLDSFSVSSEWQLPTVIYIEKTPEPTRWQVSPTVAGSVFEFQSE